MDVGNGRNVIWEHPSLLASSPGPSLAHVSEPSIHEAIDVSWSYLLHRVVVPFIQLNPSALISLIHSSRRVLWYVVMHHIPTFSYLQPSILLSRVHWSRLRNYNDLFSTSSSGPCFLFYFCLLSYLCISYYPPFWFNLILWSELIVQSFHSPIPLSSLRVVFRYAWFSLVGI